MFRAAADDAFVIGDDFQISDSALLTQNGTRVAALPGGGFVAVWADNGGGIDMIKGQVFDGSGHKVGGEFLVSPPLVAEGWQTAPKVTVLETGKFVVSWTSYNGPSFFDVGARLFDAAGTPIGEQFTLN